VGIQPGARYGSKAIPQRVLVELAERVLTEGLRPVLLGGSEELASSQGFPTPCLNLVGQLSLRESMGVASNLHVLIGADTGFMHVAAGIGCPTVTVFGPTPSAKWGHHYLPHQVIDARGGDMRAVTAAQIWATAERGLGG
jgi:ADP-heptose:LPS heptosyltransferase